MRLLNFLIVSALLCPLLSHAANLASTEGTYFEVVGFDNRSVSYVSELAEHIATQSNRYLPGNGVFFPQRILIALRPEEHVTFEGQSALSLGPQGGVRLDFLWDESLSLEQASYAITQAFLTRYAIYQYGPEAPQKMKAWPVHALALGSLHAIRPTLLMGQLKAIKDADFIGSKTLLTKSLADTVDTNFSHHAYYFLSALRQSSFYRDTIRSIIENAIAGGDPSEGISKLLPAEASAADAMTLDIWWRAERDELATEEYDVFETMTDSRVWIEQMVNFDIYREAGAEFENLRSLWKYRNDEQVRSILEARVELISLRLEIVNPLYFNAARSLGALYEIALDADVATHKFLHALVAYLGDLQDAKQIEETTLDLLDEK
ncbi:MAG: hypothetical protein ABF322_11305 [Lentimonas sp.]